MTEEKKLEGEVFYPSPETIEKARLKDWEQLAQQADEEVVLIIELERSGCLSKEKGCDQLVLY